MGQQNVLWLPKNHRWQAVQWMMMMMMMMMMMTMMMQMEVAGVVTSCWILSVIDVVKRLTVGSCQ